MRTVTVFKTDSGSTYEVDAHNKRFRRLEGLTRPTARVGEDGVWKTYTDIMGPIVGQSTIIVWQMDMAPSDHPESIVMRTTMTGYVTQIIEKEL